METKKRLIDAKPLMEDGWHLVKTGKSNVFLASMSLADVPTVDAVEVVRCKDCEHWTAPWLKDQFMGVCNCGRKEITEPNFYCAFGERKCP